MVLATAVDTPALDTPVSATAVATSEDMATATAVVTDTTVRLTQPKDKHNAGAQLSPELASVSALSYLTAGYYLATKESKLKYISCKCDIALSGIKVQGLIDHSIFTSTLPTKRNP